MRGAQAAAVAAAEAAAQAVGERVARDIQAVAERQSRAERHAAAEMDALVTQVLPLHEENSALRATIEALAARVEAMESSSSSGAADAAANAATAAAVAAAVGAEVDVLRAQTSRQMKASQEWTTQAIVHQGQQQWEHVQKMLTQRDKAEHERVTHLQRLLDDAHRGRVDIERKAEERRRRREASDAATRHRVEEAHRAVADIKEEMKRQAEHQQAQALQMHRAAEESVRFQQQQQEAAWEAHREAMEQQRRAQSERLKAESAQLAAATASGNSGAAFAGQLNSILQRLSQLESTPLPPPPSSPSRFGGVVEGLVTARMSELERRVSELGVSSSGVSSGSVVDLRFLEDRVAALESGRGNRGYGAEYAATRLVGDAGANDGADLDAVRRKVANIESRVEMEYDTARDFKDRLARLESRSGSAAAAAAASSENDDVHELRVKLATFEARIARAEEAAAGASSTSPSTKKAVPMLKSKMKDMELDIAARLADVEGQIATLAANAVENAAAVAAAPEPITTSRQHKLRELATSAANDVVAEVRSQVEALEESVKKCALSASGRRKTPPSRRCGAASGKFQVRSIQKFFTHRSVSTFDRVPFQLTDELFLYGMALSRGRASHRRRRGRRHRVRGAESAASRARERARGRAARRGRGGDRARGGARERSEASNGRARRGDDAVARARGEPRDRERALDDDGRSRARAQDRDGRHQGGRRGGCASGDERGEREG